MADRADRGGPLPPRHHGGGRPRLPRPTGTTGWSSRRGQRHEGRQSPEKPVLVSQSKYDLQRALHPGGAASGAWARAAPTPRGATATTSSSATRSTPSKAATGLKDGNDLTFGRHARCSTSPTSSSRRSWRGTSPPTAGCTTSGWRATRSTWATTRAAPGRWTSPASSRATCSRQGREISWILTADAEGNRPRATFAWGAVVKNGNIYVPDINTGLWILKLEPKAGAATP